jgi:cysteine synthase A
MPGIGVGFIPEILNRAILDEIIVVTDEEAFSCARRLAREEGIVAGVSSGAAVHAALRIAARPESEGTVAAVIIPDTGERYLATALFQHD